MRSKIIIGLMAVFLLVAAAAAVVCFSEPVADKTTVQKMVKNPDGIAVVNLDEGIESPGGRQIFFAKSIIDFPDENFFYTTYEDGKKGVESGKYAALIVIPATFSKSVESLNNVLDKSEIKYSISSEIEEKSRRKAVEDVLIFGQNLSRDISYMYVNDIMEDFHSAQDDSKKVLDNDLADKEAIESIKAEGLISMVEIPDLTISVNKAEKFDGSSYSNENIRLADEIDEDFSDNIDKSNDNIKKIDSYLAAFLEVLDNTIKDIRSKSDIAGDALTDGVSKVYDGFHEMIDKSNENIDSLKDDIETMSENSRIMAENYDISKNRYKEETENAVHEAVAKASSDIVSLEQTDDYVKVYVSGYEESGITVSRSENSRELTVSGNISGLNDSISKNIISRLDIDKVNYDGIVYHRVSDDKIEAITISENGIYRNLTFKDVIADDSYLTQMREHTSNIRYPDAQDLRSSVSKNVIKPIEKNVDNWKSAVDKAGKSIESGLGSMNDDIKKIDWKYDEDDLFDKINMINDNLSKYEEGVIKSNLSFEEYAEGIVEGTDGKLSLMADNILKAEEESEAAVRESVSGAKAVKYKTSEENQLLLKGFSELLPNTRLGSMEYTQAYDFISNPLYLSDESVEEKSGVLGTIIPPEDKPDTIRMIILMSLSFIMGMIIMFLGGRLAKRIRSKK